MNKEQIQALYLDNKLEEASALLAPPAAQNDPWAIYMLGRIAWKQGRKTDAITIYEQAAALDPGSEAAVALEQAHEIMAFFNKDLYNP